MLTLTSTALGGGVLSVSYVLSLCGVGLGTLMLVAGAGLSFVSTKVLMQMSTQTGCESYAALLSHCAGPRAGPVLDAMLVVYGCGSCVGYFVFLGDFIPSLMKLIAPHGPEWLWDRWLSIALAAGLLVPLVLPRDLSALRHMTPFSILSLMYMATVVAAKCPALYHQSLSNPAAGNLQVVVADRHFFEAFAICVFAFNCHLNVVPVATRMIEPSRARIVKVSYRVNLLQVCFYSLIGITGYLSFLGTTPQDIIKGYPADDPFVAFGRFMLTGTMMVAIPVNLNPTMRSAIQLKNYFSPPREPFIATESQPSTNDEVFRVSITLISLFIQAVLAVLVPGVADVLSLLGATVATAMMLAIPAYAMGVVMEPKPTNKAIQVILYIFALVSVSSVPIKILRWARVFS